MCRILLLAVVLQIPGTLTRAAEEEIASGPKPGEKTPALKLQLMDREGKFAEKEFTADRTEKPTIYVFVQAAEFSRPIARFLRSLDESVIAVDPNTAILAVWLTDDAAASQRYLPRAQQSLRLKETFLGVWKGEGAGPKGWNVDSSAPVSVVVANGPKVFSSKGFRSVNETLAQSITKSLAAAVNQDQGKESSK